MSFPDYSVEVSLVSGGSYQLQAIKPLFTPLFSESESGLMYINDGNMKGCGDGGVSAQAKGKIVVLERGTCTFVEKVRIGRGGRCRFSPSPPPLSRS